MSVIRFVSRLASAAVAMSFLAVIPALAVAQDSVSAVWATKDVHFIYQGFTTRYSCDGLRDQVKALLEKLGAQDLKVREAACTSPPGVPSPFPGVVVKMRVLVPASSADASKEKDAGQPVQAHWKSVVLMPATSSYQDQGNCELIEQFKRTFLPLFTTRNVKYQTSCVPHQITLGTHLSAEVLAPPAKVASGASY